MLLPSSRVLTLLSLPFRSFHAGASARCLGSKVKVKTRPSGGPRAAACHRERTRHAPGHGPTGAAANNFLRIALLGPPRTFLIRQSLLGLPRTFQVRSLAEGLPRLQARRSLPGCPRTGDLVRALWPPGTDWSWPGGPPGRI